MLRKSKTLSSVEEALIDAIAVTLYHDDYVGPGTEFGFVHPSGKMDKYGDRIVTVKLTEDHLKKAAKALRRMKNQWLKEAKRDEEALAKSQTKASKTPKPPKTPHTLHLRDLEIELLYFLLTEHIDSGRYIGNKTLHYRHLRALLAKFDAAYLLATTPS